MIVIVKTASTDQDFINLVKYLDADLAVRDGENHTFYARYNTLDEIKHVVVAYDNGQAVGCGAIKEYAPDTMEVKRMYTSPKNRRKGIASQILARLEEWAREIGYRKCILETGKTQPEAIGLYQKHGYHRISNYGQYAGLENSVCFEKILIEM